MTDRDPSPPRPPGSRDPDSHAAGITTPGAGAPSINLAAGLWRHALSTPRATALVVDGRAYTYAELAARAAGVAAWLRAVRDQRDGVAGRVGILAARSPEAFAGILGAAWTGAAYVPVNPKQPAARIASILRRACLTALIVDRGAAPFLGDDQVRAALPARVLVADEEAAGGVSGPVVATAWSSLPKTDAITAPVDVSAGQAVYVMFTSGTTGEPKGVVVGAGAVAHFLAAAGKRYAIGPGDRLGQFCETSFDVSVFEMFAAWNGGASLHVVPDAQLMAPAAFIRREALTIWTSVPSVIAMLTRMRMLAPGMFPSLRASFFIGEALTVESARAWQAAAPASVVDNQYGPTEAAVACTVQRLTDPVVETAGRGTLAIGRPYEGTHAAILACDGSFAADGVSGELALAGPQLAIGYLDDPEQTALRFPVIEHARLGSLRWYRTGDLAVRDRDGVLHCLGRIDHQVKVLGHRVELEDVEAHLRSASGVEAVAAVAWPLVDGNAAGVVGFVCVHEAAVPAIRARLRELLPPYMAPRRIVTVEAMPRTANGKIDRGALLALLQGKR